MKAKSNAELAELLSQFQKRLDTLRLDLNSVNRTLWSEVTGRPNWADFDELQESIAVLASQIANRPTSSEQEAQAKQASEAKASLDKLVESVQKSFDAVRHDMEKIYKQVQSQQARISELESQNLALLSSIQILNVRSADGDKIVTAIISAAKEIVISSPLSEPDDGDYPYSCNSKG